MGRSQGNQTAVWRLIEAAQGGEADAVRELVLMYQDRLRTFLLRMVNNYHDAEEIAQETFIAAISALGRYRREFRFTTWLYTIAYRRAVNHIKTNRRRKVVSLEFMPEAAVAEPAILDSIASIDAAQMLRDHVWREVRKLSVNQRAAVWFHYHEQMPIDQIAEVLSTPVSTVKSHLFRGRAALRKALGPMVARLDDLASSTIAAQNTTQENAMGSNDVQS